MMGRGWRTGRCGGKVGGDRRLIVVLAVGSGVGTLGLVDGGWHGDPAAVEGMGLFGLLCAGYR